MNSSVSGSAQKFVASLDRRVDEILEACTRCGACEAVCPTPVLKGIETTVSNELVSGILEILRDGSGPAKSEEWAKACCGTGVCGTVCEYGINPRFMLAMARRALNESRPEYDRKTSGRDAFRKMSRGVRVLSRLQLPQEILNRISPKSHPERTDPPDLIFYTGCNMLKTPHIGLLCLDILERMGFTYEVYGGPSACCGILQFRSGDDVNAGRQAFTTIERFKKTKASEVLSWCPTCQIQFNEVSLPSYEETTGSSFAMTMFPVFLLRHIDKLRPHLIHSVNKRVSIHKYAGGLGVVEAVNELLSTIPGLKIVDLGNESIGYTGTALEPMKEYRKASVLRSLQTAEDLNIDTLIGIYHSDHREFSGHEEAWNFTIANYMELIGESMGIRQPDIFKQLKLMRDVDAILVSTSKLIEEHGLNLEEVREVVLADMIGDQHLPIDRTHHFSE